MIGGRVQVFLTINDERLTINGLALRVFVIATQYRPAWSFVRSPQLRGGMPKALGLQDDNDSINLLSGITRRGIGLFAKNTWELVIGLL